MNFFTLIVLLYYFQNIPFLFQKNSSFNTYLFGLILRKIFKINNQISIRQRSSSKMSNTYLDDEQSSKLELKGHLLKYQLKIKHLNHSIQKLEIENKQLHSKLKYLQEQKAKFLKNSFNQNIIISGLIKEGEELRMKNSQFLKKNEELQTTILLNEQLNIESKKQLDIYLAQYQQKIKQLRLSLQMKQVQIQSIEEKYEKSHYLLLPVTISNTNMYNTQLKKYEQLIQKLTAQCGRNRFQSLEQMNSFLNSFQKSHEKFSENLKGSKSSKSFFLNTQVRNSLIKLQHYQENRKKFNNQDLATLQFLKTHLQLRQLQKKYRKKVDENQQFKRKDQIMKQGYLTLTREIQKVRVQNCQLKIKLQYLEKKQTLSNQVSKPKSAHIILKYNKEIQNVEEKFSSQISIQGKIAQFKNRLTLKQPSKTNNKTFLSNKIQKLKEKTNVVSGDDLSAQSQDQQSQIANQEGQTKDEDCFGQKQNNFDLSISLDTSALQNPKGQFHKITDNFLDQLF